MRKLTAMALACGMLLAATGVVDTARATIVRAFSLGALSAEAQSIVRGTVVDQEVVYDARWGRVYTHSLIEVEEVLWGTDRPGDFVVVRQIGGELDGVLSMVVGTAPVRLGDEVVTFARVQEGLHFLVGMAQGLYQVDRADAATPRVARGVSGLKLVAPAGPVRPVAPHRMGLDQLRARVQASLAAQGRLP